MWFIDASDAFMKSKWTPALVEANCYYASQSVVSGTASCLKPFPPPGPPSVPILSFVGLSGDGSGAVNVTVSWTLSAGDSANFYLINITTNAPLLPYGGLFNVSIRQLELAGFMADYEYNITCSPWCQLWESGREWEWAPDNRTSRYTSLILISVT